MDICCLSSREGFEYLLRHFVRVVNGRLERYYKMLMEMSRYHVTFITAAPDGDDGDAFLVRYSATKNPSSSTFYFNDESSSLVQRYPGPIFEA